MGCDLGFDDTIEPQFVGSEKFLCPVRNYDLLISLKY